MVYSGEIIEAISVDVSRLNRMDALFVKQGDAYTRKYKATITNDGVPIEIPNTATILFNCQNLADQTKKSTVEGTVNNDGTVTVQVPQVVMQVPGNIQCDIAIRTTSDNDTQVLKTMTFMLECQKAANPTGTSTQAEDDIINRLLSGTISALPTIIDSETSGGWGGEIPNTYPGATGIAGEIAFLDYAGTMWFLSDVVESGGTTNYEWIKFA